jgi:hypothetical protein
MTDPHARIAQLEAALRETVVAYDRSNPMRTADMHLNACQCLRCAIDRARDTIASAPAPAQHARIAQLEAALTEIAGEISVPVPTSKNGINFKKLYNAWRKEATTRADIARAALASAPAPDTTAGAVQEAALIVADAIDKDPTTINALITGLGARPDWTVRHFFSASLRALAGETE